MTNLVHTTIDIINAARADLNKLEAIVRANMPKELPAETLYKWDMIPAGYNYAACDEYSICAYEEYPDFIDDYLWMVESGRFAHIPLAALNRLPGEPKATIEKRPGVE